MKAKNWVFLILIVAVLFFCYWMFDSKIVTVSVLAAGSVVNAFNTIKRRKNKQEKLGDE